MFLVQKRILEQRLYHSTKFHWKSSKRRVFGLVRSTVSVAVLTLMRGLRGQFG